MSFRVLFLRCLIPRLALAVWFSAIGYYGSGGDAETYHILGGLLRDQVRSPGRASIEGRLYAEGVPQLEESYIGHQAIIEGLPVGEADLTWRSSVLPIVFLHGLLYLVWDHALIYVLFTSILSAAATAFFVRSMGVASSDAKWFIYNPASIFFAATHFKESLTEAIVLFFVPAVYRFRRWIPALLLILLLGFFRFTYVPILLAFLAMRAFGLDQVKTRTLVVATLVLFVVLPPFYLEHTISLETAGPVYSVVYANGISRKLLGPLVGLLLPMPFMLPLSYGGYIGGVFHAVYGLFYWFVLTFCGVYVLGQTRRNVANTYLNLAALASLSIGYVYLGASGLKERYFAPVLPVMILAFVMVKPTVLRLFASLTPPAVNTGTVVPDSHKP